jgi:hypothetical protein
VPCQTGMLSAADMGTSGGGRSKRTVNQHGLWF